MKDSNKILATRKLLEQQGDKPEEIESVINLIRINEKKEKFESLRSWIAVIISGVALIVSICVAIQGYLNNNLVKTSVVQIQLSPTVITSDVNTNIQLLESNLISTDDWQIVSFPQNIIVSQGGESKFGKIALKIPPDWTKKTIHTRGGRGIGGGMCDDFELNSRDEETFLVIKPSCDDSDNKYLPISGPVQKVKLSTKVGNDGHDSYTVRYYDSLKNIYHYGSIDISPGTSIDINKDKIYPNLVLHYDPDRLEQWLWISVNLTYTGTSVNQQNAISTADTIISTLKLID